MRPFWELGDANLAASTYNPLLVTSAKRSWIRVFALITLVVALAGGFTASRAHRYEAPFHVIEARQGTSSSDSAALLQSPTYHSEAHVTASSQEQDSRNSLSIHTHGHVLQIKAQPPPCASTRHIAASQHCFLAWSPAQTFNAKIQSVHHLPRVRSQQALYVQQSYSRPPPFLI